MTTKVSIAVPEPVGASNVKEALSRIPGLPPIAAVTCRHLTVDVEFALQLTADQASTVQAYGMTLPLVARIVRYSKVASEDCHKAIVGGVQSNATGTSYWYDSDIEAQLNMVGAVVSGTDTYWFVRQFKDGPKQAVIHTPAQLVAVGQAIKAWKEERIYVFQTFRARLEACASTAECDALWATWDSYAPPQYQPAA